MPRTQPRVAALLGVARRAPKAEDEEIPQTLLCGCKVVLLVHRAEDRVRRHLSVERADRAVESILADCGVDIAFVHTLRSLKITTEDAENAEGLRLKFDRAESQATAPARYVNAVLIELNNNKAGNRPLRPLRSLR